MSPSWNQPAYTSADMLTMQQDALRRVREMQACPGIHDVICLSGNGASHYIDYAKYSGSPLLGFSEGRQSIRRFAGLADHDHQGPVIQNRIPVAEF